MTIQTPNSPSPDVMLSGRCVTRPEFGMPCTTAANHYKAARSRHPNGVNVGMGDGAVRYVTNNINLTTWRALGTMNGGEGLDDF